MNDCKVQRVSKELDCRYSDIQKKKVPLPLLFFKRTMCKAEEVLCKVSGAVFIGWVVWEVVTPMAYIQRGYHAYGGECILIILIFIIIMSIFLRKVQ